MSNPSSCQFDFFDVIEDVVYVHINGFEPEKSFFGSDRNFWLRGLSLENWAKKNRKDALSFFKNPKIPEAPIYGYSDFEILAIRRLLDC